MLKERSPRNFKVVLLVARPLDGEQPPSRVLELDRIGVQVVSVREPWLDTSGPVRSLLIAIFSWCAEQEPLRLIERTRAGLDRARRQGKMLGRPRTSSVLLHAAADLVARGQPVAAAARTKGVSRAALRRWLAENPSPLARRTACCRARGSRGRGWPVTTACGHRR